MSDDNVIRFRDYARDSTKPIRPAPNRPADVIILPIVRVERPNLKRKKSR